jgi:hypothetical protein
MMQPLEGLAGQITFAGKNTSYNLKFIPEDKLDWKPAPSAKSALEIVNHLAYFLAAMAPVIRGAEWAEPQFTPAANLAEAQSTLESVAEDYAAALRTVSAADLGRIVRLPFGEFPLARAATMGVVDAIHHHGQIAYIQTLLGDEAMHFFEMGT